MSESTPLEKKVEAILRSAGLVNAASETLQILAAAATETQALQWAADRTRGVPLAYCTGIQKFMGYELLAAPGALVPREETELLGHTAVTTLRQKQSPSLRIIDMCCGSGNLACALALSLPESRVWAADLTDGCVLLARRNAAYLGLGDRLKVVQGDLFVPLEDTGLEESIDAIVCNPPYISTTRLVGDRAELLRHEPREAFDAGPYGISIHQRTIREAPRFLRPGGVLLCEFGLGQERQMRALIDRTQAYECLEFFSNDAGAPRVFRGVKKQS